MALEYEDLIVDPAVDVAEDALNAYAAEGWRVHTAYSPTRFLLERGTTPPVRRVQQPSAPTGTRG